MERRRVTLTPYQKQIIRQKAIDRHIAGKQARELLAGIPRCSCHDYLEPLCPNHPRLGKSADPEVLKTSAE